MNYKHRKIQIYKNNKKMKNYKNFIIKIKLKKMKCVKN